MNTPASSKWRRILSERPLLLSGLIFVFALLPRLVAIGRYITPDELIWVYRSVNFREALLAGAWADTLQAGHPGVITMWLGTLGSTIQLLIRPADAVAYRWITHLAWLTPDNVAAFKQLSVFLSSGRLMVALVNSLGIVAIYWMGRALLKEFFAILLVVLLILDPFLSGLAGILHVDGLATTFATISLLALTLSLTNGGEKSLGRRAVLAAVSGASASLAVLAKSPLLLLVPFAALMFILSLWQRREQPLAPRFGRILITGLVWLGAFVFCVVIMFPALWAAPGQVLQIMGSNANRHVEEALRPTFFMGEVAFDHGALFYPAALAWRMGPLTMLGLIVLLFLAIRSRWRERLPSFVVILWSLWALLFVAVVTLAAKKFDRYALPAIPALILLAAVGWSVWLPQGKRWKRWLFAAVLLVQFAYALFVFPYPLSAYNLLLGGPYTAQYVLPIGWGESVSSAGRWLSTREGVEAKSAVSGLAPSLAPFFTGQTLVAEVAGYDTADFQIETLNGQQMSAHDPAQNREERQLLKVIRFGGLPQAWIYENPEAVKREIRLDELASPITFGAQMQLVGQQLTHQEDEVAFTARWNGRKSEERLLVHLRLLDGDGHEWSNLETALLNENYFFPEYWEDEERPVVTYRLSLPPAMPPADYAVEMSVADMESEAWLPVLGVDGDFQGVSYEAGSIVIPPPEAPIDTQQLVMVPAEDASWDDGSLQLLGYGRLPERVVTGGEFTLDLYWQASSGLPTGLDLAVKVNGEEVLVTPLSRYESGLWQPGTIIQEKYLVQMPASAQSGEGVVTLRPQLADGKAMKGAEFQIGKVELQPFDRLFTLPDEFDMALAFSFGPGIHLRGANVEASELSAGEILPLVLYWQTETATEAPVTAFVHLVDEQGNVVTQDDRWPGGLPSNIWVENQVIVDEYTLDLPLGLETGDYQIVVGLYDAESGERLSAVDGSGTQLPDDSVILPLTIRITASAS